MQFILTRRGLIQTVSAAILLVGANAAMAADPEDLGDQIFQIYLDTLAQASAALAGTPEPSAALGETLDTIKEASVRKLVTLGHEVATLSESDHETVERTVRMSISGIMYKPDSKKIYEDYQAVWAAYVKQDKAFFSKIKSLNILTQYAFFDLLRKQEPDEADRLGV